MPTTPDDLDIVQVIKQEWSDLGGGEGSDYPSPNVPLSPFQDAPEVPCLFIVEAGRRNKAVAIWPYQGKLRFRDVENPGIGGEGYTLTQVLSGTAGDEKAKVSVNDTTAGYLNGKLVAGTGITLVELNDGSNESLRIDSEGGGSSGQRAIALSWGTNATAYIYAYSSGDWNVMARIVFPGTTHLQATVDFMKAILWVGQASRPMDARIYDLTNDLVIAEADAFTNENPELIDFGTISNVPTGPAIWEIQGHKDSVPAGFIYMSALTMFLDEV